MTFRVGLGWDQHPLRAGRPLVLGGETLPAARGLDGHSDADVLVHAVCDAVLGALGDPDLGTLWPSRDPALRGIDSRALLRRVAARMFAAGFRVGNLDTVVVAQEPRLADRLAAMRRNLAADLGCPEGAVSVKAKSPEGVGSLGRSDGIAAQAVVLLAPAAADGPG